MATQGVAARDALTCGSESPDQFSVGTASVSRNAGNAHITSSSVDGNRDAVGFGRAYADICPSKPRGVTAERARGGGGVIDRMHEWVCSTRMAARARCDCEPGAEGWSRPVGRSATASANATTSCAAATLSHRRNSERDQLSEACAIEDNAFTRTGNSAAACGRSTSTPSLIPCSQAECFVSELLGSEGNEFGGRPTRPSRRAYQGASTVCGDSPVRVLR